jgi:micrococcal nuclease
MISRTKAICLFFAVILLAVPFPAMAEQYPVLHIVDGDTIDIDYNGIKERIRFLCVDTPESVHPDRKQNIPMGKTASDYTKKRLLGKSVEIQLESKTRGRYGRLLAYVFIDGQNFNVDLVKQGLSPYYTKYGRSEKFNRAFQDAEKSARKTGLNIWGDPALTAKYLRLKSKWGMR